MIVRSKLGLLGAFVALVVLLSPITTTSAFVPRSLTVKQRVRHTDLVPYHASEDGREPLPSGEKRKATVGRAGGRSLMSRVRSASTKKPSRGQAAPWLPIMATIAGVLLMLLLLFRSPQLGSPGYVFYESNVYESRVYKPDGNVETSRRESFKTNLQSQNALDIQRKVEADFNAMDMEMNRELEAMTRLQQAMLEGMFR